MKKILAFSMVMVMGLVAADCAMAIGKLKKAISTPEISFMFIIVFLVFDFMGVAYTAKGQVEQFPFVAFLLIEFRYGKLVFNVISPYVGGKRNAVPEHGGIIPKNFHGHVVHVGIFVPDASRFDDFELPVLFPGTAHVHEF